MSNGLFGTAVRDMCHAGVPQIVRMRITGHRTDSMERRYNIMDVDNIRVAKSLMKGLAESEIKRGELIDASA